MSTSIPDRPNELVLDALPGKSEDGSYIYALQFSTGIVKVGWSANPAARLRSHEQTARMFGQRVERHWLSTPHANAADNERKLIQFCAERAPRTSGAAAGEYFVGEIFDDVVAFASTLAFEVRTAEEREIEQERARAFGRSLRQQMEQDFGRRFALPPLAARPASWSESPTPDLIEVWSRALEFPVDAVERFDGEDHEALQTHLLAVHNAANDVAAFEWFLEKARHDHDVIALDGLADLRNSLAEKHGVETDWDRGPTAERMSAVRKRLEADHATWDQMSHYDRLIQQMVNFTGSQIVDFEKQYDVTINTDAPVYRLFRGGIREDKAFSGSYRAMFSAPDGRYFARIEEVAAALGRPGWFPFDEIGDDEYAVLWCANTERGMYDTELMASSAAARLAQLHGMGEPVLAVAE